MDISMIATLLKRLGAVCFVFLVFWHVAHPGAPQRGRAIVRVTGPDDVVVSVDHFEYLVHNTGAPVVCDLVPGTHVAEVWRHGVLLGEESFVVEPGKEVVITPVHRKAGALETMSVPSMMPPERPGRAGLAARMPRPGRDAAHN